MAMGYVAAKAMWLWREDTQVHGESAGPEPELETERETFLFPYGYNQEFECRMDQVLSQDDQSTSRVLWEWVHTP